MSAFRLSTLLVCSLLLASCGGGADGGPVDARPQVLLTVSNGAGVSGSIVITLEHEKTPLTVSNFLAYVNSGFYVGTVFHRHGRKGDLSTFVMQGGGYAGPIDPNAAYPAHKTTSAPIALEAGRGLSNLRYTVAMARTGVLDSATSEFFINTTDNAFLDTSGGGYAVFGTVTSGTAVVDAMVAAACSSSTANFGVGSPDCIPNPNITITAAARTR